MTNAPFSGLREWVALDLETTGLSAKADEIIEIGAVRFTARETLGEFQTFINPNRQIPKFITDLTGITQSDVNPAPTISDVGDKFADFVAGATLIAHNADFDMGFLRESGISLANPVCDTMELAQLTRPYARSYALEQLAKSESDPIARAHRALDDARAVQSVFLALISDLADMDPTLLAQFRRLSDRSGWQMAALLESAREFASPYPSRSRSASASGIDENALFERLSQPSPLRAASETVPVDPYAVAEALSYGSGFAGSVPDFEERPQQIEMGTAVAEIINSGGRLMVEAGTGVGKSLAYLLPAALYALANDKRVVISTNTINLQEQLIRKDLPMVKNALKSVDPDMAEEMRFTQLKGRANYLCYKRWRQAVSSGELDPNLARLVAKTMLWMPQTDTGDRAELNLGPRPAAAAWSRLSAERAHQCPSQVGPCFLKSARDKAAGSHIIVVNHALLLSDLVAGGSAIPDYDVLILDEAHHLEDQATRQLGFSIGPSSVDDILSELLGERGLLNQCTQTTQRSALAESRKKSARETVSLAILTAQRLREEVSGPFRVVSGEVFGNRRRSSSRFAQDKRLTDAERSAPGWKAVETAWENAAILLRDLSRALSNLVTAMEGIDADDEPGYESLVSDVVANAQNLDALRSQAGECLVNPAEDGVYWIREDPRSSDVTLNSAPIYVGDLLEDALYSKKETVIMTSATLSASGSFDHVSGRLGFSDSRRLALGSPFDFYKSALIYVPRDMPQPNAPGFQQRVEDLVMEAATAADGRTMALFTSYAALRATADTIRAPLARSGIQVLAQGADGSPMRIAERFVEDPRSVLLGTSSFWEGVDFAGDALTVLIVARLPFSVPSDPVFQARGERYSNSFNEYAVPQAIIRFRQGFGRLIRTSRDRGVAIVLDSRITGRRYGREFIKSLPKMRVTDGKGKGAGNTITRWLEYS